MFFGLTGKSAGTVVAPLPATVEDEFARLSVLPEYFRRNTFPTLGLIDCDTQVSAGFAGNRRHSFPVRKESMMENSMVIASNKMTSVMLGLFVCALGISVSSSADARKVNRQPTYVNGGYPNPTPSITVVPRNTPKANNPLRAARSYRYGRRSRSIDPGIFASRCERLLRRRRAITRAPIE